MSSTHLSLRLQTKQQVAWTATVALVGIVYFVVSIVALHILRRASA